MTTLGQLIDETLLALTGYTQRQDQATYLTANLTDSALTFTVQSDRKSTRLNSSHT